MSCGLCFANEKAEILGYISPNLILEPSANIVVSILEAWPKSESPIVLDSPGLISVLGH